MYLIVSLDSFRFSHIQATTLCNFVWRFILLSSSFIIKQKKKQGKINVKKALRKFAKKQNCQALLGWLLFRINVSLSFYCVCALLSLAPNPIPWLQQTWTFRRKSYFPSQRYVVLRTVFRNSTLLLLLLLWFYMYIVCNHKLDFFFIFLFNKNSTKMRYAVAANQCTQSHPVSTRWSMFCSNIKNERMKTIEE